MRVEDSQEVKVDRQEEIMNRTANLYRSQRDMRLLFGFWKKWYLTKKKYREDENYCEDFYLQGLILRAFKGFKVFALMAGNN